MRNITDIALEKYPPKGMADPQDWEHDENAELRKAFTQGYECALNEVLQSLYPNYRDNMRKMAEVVNAQNVSLNKAMKDAMEELVHNARQPWM